MADQVDTLVRAAGELSIERRADKNRWVHLSLCVLDAVFSIGARYSGVTKVCYRYARHAKLTDILRPHRDAATVIGTDKEQPLDEFVAHMRAVGPTRFASEVVLNRGRTSTRNGILKAEAAQLYAEILVTHQVRTLGDVAELLATPDRLETVENALRPVKGNGSAGIRLGYLWMLTGDDEHIKPDRMVLRWLAQHVGPVDPAHARTLITATARRIGHTPWELDHAIWRHRSGRAG